MLLAVTQTVVATPVATPVIQVVHDTVQVVKTVPAVAPELLQGLQVLLLALTGVIGSVMHQVFESLSKRKDGWSRGFNLALQLIFGLVVAGLASYLTGTLQLTWSSGLDFAAEFLVVMGSSQTRYAFFKWVNSLGSDNVTEIDPIAQAGADTAVTIPTKAAL